MSFIGSLAPYPAIIRGAVGVSQKSKFSARVYAFTLIACSRSGHMNSLCILMSSQPAPISSAATPKIQFGQHLDGGFVPVQILAGHRGKPSPEDRYNSFHSATDA